MATHKELSDFLAYSERRAFKQALYAVRKEEAALDIMQDTMIKLAEKYGNKPVAELPMLFQRILQNTITDYFRREKTQTTWLSLFSSFIIDDDDHGGDSDHFNLLEVHDTHATESSLHTVERQQTLTFIDQEIQKLPERQRQAFLMRYWEEMNVSQTAIAMGCSEGSVKTHCARATEHLAQALKAKGISL